MYMHGDFMNSSFEPAAFFITFVTVWTMTECPLLFPSSRWMAVLLGPKLKAMGLLFFSH